MIDHGEVTPLLDARHFNLEQVGEAHALLEAGDAVGKVVVEIRR
jgi:NADPH2:quinone reductase